MLKAEVYLLVSRSGLLGCWRRVRFYVAASTWCGVIKSRDEGRALMTL